MHGSNPKSLSRRNLLLAASAAIFFVSSTRLGATIIKGAAPWKPFSYSPPETLALNGWHFLTPNEARAVEAIVDCLVPADELSVGGKEAGCAVFIDRQLAGSFGTAERLYMKGPFLAPTAMQGDQSPLTPRERYRTGLASLDDFCRQHDHLAFADLPADRKEEVLTALETGNIELKGIEAKTFFSTLLQNTMEGFFSDPIYGGNRDMVSWKMLGFPGARYDYREYVELHDQRIDLPPLSIAGRPQWDQGR